MKRREGQTGGGPHGEGWIGGAVAAALRVNASVGSGHCAYRQHCSKRSTSSIQFLPFLFSYLFLVLITFIFHYLFTHRWCSGLGVMDITHDSPLCPACTCHWQANQPAIPNPRSTVPWHRGITVFHYLPHLPPPPFTPSCHPLPTRGMCGYRSLSLPQAGCDRTCVCVCVCVRACLCLSEIWLKNPEQKLYNVKRPLLTSSLCLSNKVVDRVVNK